MLVWGYGLYIRRDVSSVWSTQNRKTRTTQTASSKKKQFSTSISNLYEGYDLITLSRCYLTRCPGIWFDLLWTEGWTSAPERVELSIRGRMQRIITQASLCGHERIMAAYLELLSFLTLLLTKCRKTLPQAVYWEVSVFVLWILLHDIWHW